MAKEAAKLYEEKTGTKATVINPYYITGVDDKLLTSLKLNHKAVVTLEDGILDGGFGEKIARFFGNSNVKVLNFGLKRSLLTAIILPIFLRKTTLPKSRLSTMFSH